MFIKNKVLRRALSKRLSLEKEWTELRRRNPNVLTFVEEMELSLASFAKYGESADLIKLDDAAMILKGAILGYNYLVEMQEYANKKQRSDNTNRPNNPLPNTSN